MNGCCSTVVAFEIIENTIKLTPHIGDLEYVNGSFPTKFGVLKISHKKNAKGKITTSFEAPKGLKIIK